MLLHGYVKKNDEIVRKETISANNSRDLKKRSA